MARNGHLFHGLSGISCPIIKNETRWKINVIHVRHLTRNRRYEEKARGWLVITDEVVFYIEEILAC